MWVALLVIGGILLGVLTMGVTLSIARDDVESSPAKIDRAAGTAMIFARPARGTFYRGGFLAGEWGELRVADGMLSFAPKEGAEPIWCYPLRSFRARVGFPSMMDQGIFLHLDHAEFGPACYQVSNAATEMNRGASVFFQDTRERVAASRFADVINGLA